MQACSEHGSHPAKVGWGGGVIEGYRTKQQVKPDCVRDREALKAALASRNKLIGAQVRVTIKTIGREWTALGNAVIHTDHTP